MVNNVVAAVAAQNPIWFDAQKFCCAGAEGCGQRIGIFLQASLNGAADGALDGRRRGVRILVRVELDDTAFARLLAGDVAVHGENFGTDDRKAWAVSVW